MKGITSAKALILVGKPIQEELVAYGPFVMNTREEIAKAYEDYSTGLFGAL
jgi:redox-sensitive bicupin YhaK (pirin superfamily)